MSDTIEQEATETTDEFAEAQVEGAGAGEADAPDAAPAFSEATLARAKEHGFSAEDLSGLDDSRAGRLFASIDRRLMTPMAQSAPGNGREAQPPAADAGPVPEFKPLKLEFGEDIDESVSKPIQTAVEYVNSGMKELHQFRQSVMQEINALNTVRQLDAFDSFLRTLGDDWQKDYGSGSTLDMDPQSAAFQKRMEVFQGAQGMVHSYAQRRQNLSFAEAWKRAHHAVYYDRIAEQERKKLNGKVAARQRQFGERPGKSRPPAMSAREAARAAWAGEK